MSPPRRGLVWFLGACCRFAILGSVTRARAIASVFGALFVGLALYALGYEVVVAPGFIAAGIGTLATFGLIWFVVVVVRLVIAPYHVWKTERDGREAAESKIEEAARASASKEEAIRTRLRLFYDEGSTLWRLALAVEHPDKSHQERFRREVETWVYKVGLWLKQNVDPAARSKFLDYGSRHDISKYTWYHGLKDHPDHNWQINLVNYHCRNLEEIMKEQGWLKP